MGSFVREWIEESTYYLLVIALMVVGVALMIGFSHIMAWAARDYGPSVAFGGLIGLFCLGSIVAAGLRVRSRRQMLREQKAETGMVM